MSNILFILSNQPYENASTEEVHDLIMASTGYGHSASVLFKNNGIYQVVAEQSVPKGRKNSAKRIAGFSFFDIDDLFVNQYELQQMGIRKDDLISSVSYLNESEMSSFSERFDLIMRF